MNTINNKRRKASKEKIEKVFIELIQTREIEEISVTDICKLAKINRSTFYANYIDIYDLVDKIKISMENDFASMYTNDSNAGHNSDSYLKMFKFIKENQIFFKTYFKLNFDSTSSPKYFHEDLATKYYDNKHIDYHMEFFKAGLNAIIKKWLNNNCKESPEEMYEILRSEYENK